MDWKDAFDAKTEDTTPDIDADFIWTKDTSADLIKRVKPRNFLALYALLASPAFTGNPTAPTQSPGTNNTRIASTAYVDAAVSAMAEGRAWKQPVRVATTANGTLATAFENGDTVDGVVLATGDRILIKDQSSATENGIYVVAASGAPARATDADSGSELVNASVFVSEGTVNADKQFVCTNNATPTLGVTSITFAVTGAGGGSVDDTAYNAGTWNGDTTNAPSKNAVRDIIETILASSGLTRTVTFSSGSFTAGSSANVEYFYFLEGAHTPTLPTAVGNSNKYTFKNRHSAAISFTTTSSQTIDGIGSTLFKIYPGEEIDIWSDGSNWITSVQYEWRTVMKNTQEDRTSTTTPADDAALLFYMKASVNYEIILNANLYIRNNPDFKYTIAVPASGTARGLLRMEGWNASATWDALNGSLPANKTILASGDAYGYLKLEGYYSNGVNAGNWAFQWSQNTSDGSNAASVLPGSHIRYREIKP